MIRTQVLVIGGGPAGSAAARFLAGNGIDVILAEKDLSFVKPCGSGIPSAVIDDLNIPRHTIKKHVNTIRIFSPAGRSLDIKLEGGAIAIVERGEFDSALRQTAERTGARIIQASFRNFGDIGKTIATFLMLNGEEISITSDYVIAADGVNSRVRASLGMGPVSSFITLSEKIRTFNTEACEFWFGSSHAPHLYSWVFPQKEGVSAGTGAFYDNNIKTALQRFVNRRGLQITPALRGYKIPLWEGNLYNNGNILFAGDAAGHVLPLTFEGIYYAIKSGELAATAVLENKPSGYKALWEKRFKRRFSIIKRLWRYFLKNDRNAEKLVELHTRQEILDASVKLWLRKDMSKESLFSYINAFNRFIR